MRLWSLKDLSTSDRTPDVKLFGKKDQPIVSVAFNRNDNNVLTLSLNGALKIIDVRMESNHVRKYEDDHIMEQFLGLGHSKVEVSEDGRIAFVLSPRGQITAYNLNDGRIVGTLNNKSEMIKDFCCYPNSSMIAAIDR